MKLKKMKPALERKIDLYVHGKLDDEQIDDLWAELIQDEHALDYLKTVASLKGIVEEESGIHHKFEKQTVADQDKTSWYVAAAAAIILIVGGFGIMTFTAETDSIQPITTIELDYYRSADGTTGGSGGDAVIREAIILANDGHHQQAVNVIDDRLANINDSDARALLFINAGSILYNISMYEEAAIRFERVVAIEESDPLVRERAYWYLGNTYFQLNKLEEAKNAFENAYQLNGAYSRVAQSYLRALASR
jgi:tetratricopeptide (TPR) repeat protein